MIKKIKLYFINKKIKKTQKNIAKTSEDINWLKNHIHDYNPAIVTNELAHLNNILKLYETLLRAYTRDAERIKNK